MKFKSLTMAAAVAALSTVAMADDVAPKILTSNATINFTGSVTRPTCVISLNEESIALPKVATTAFKQKGDTAGDAVTFTVNLQQNADNGGQAGAACPSVSVSGATETPNIKFSLTDAGLTSDKKALANTADNSKTIGVEILNDADTVIDFSTEETAAATPSTYNVDSGALTYKARYVALADTVAEQDIKASLSFSVIYK
ncbi:fimbrial protein [Acinetobacter shaoyimingii]|uniref:Type 1 fimbrial protein n=1 Tax=Acinetobacter shaoyimingii TaxID=2715164 RepID=A0A6G8RVC1_9GAMM|nr:fimbrial protein [Acinetobacter shaoyimingii]NHB58632.1 type 1 fimbrial protein [Acinetobacter shaoyimingii]QIO05738.1 type 1 fimbrial protein [Acinetobacter shaoyimingii]